MCFSDGGLFKGPFLSDKGSLSMFQMNKNVIGIVVLSMSLISMSNASASWTDENRRPVTVVAVGDITRSPSPATLSTEDLASDTRSKDAKTQAEVTHPYRSRGHVLASLVDHGNQLVAAEVLVALARSPAKEIPAVISAEEGGESARAPKRKLYSIELLDGMPALVPIAKKPRV